MALQQNVIIFSTAYLPMIGGAELAVQELTRRMPDIGFFLITARFNRKFPRFEKIDAVEVYRVGIGHPFLDKLFSPFLGALLARRLMKRHHITCFWSIMVSFTSLAPFILKVFSLHRQVPILLTIQEGDSDKHIQYGRLGLISFWWRIALRYADHVQVISSYLADMARKYGYKKEISIIPNGVDLEKFKVESSKLNGSQKTDKIVVTVSRLVEKNGVDTLLRAIEIVKKKIPSVRCIVIGDGPLRKKLEDLSKDLKIQDNLIFAGTVSFEDIPKHLGGADLFVRASRSEGLGTAFLEAMAVGLPVIGTPVGGIPDFLRDGETGLFCKVDDPEDLAEKIVLLLENKELAVRLSKNGRKLIEKQYMWDNVAKEMKDIFYFLKPKA